MPLNKRLAVACVVLLTASWSALAKQDDDSSEETTPCSTPFQWDFTAEAYITTGNTPATCGSNCLDVRGRGCSQRERETCWWLNLGSATRRDETRMSPPPLHPRIRTGGAH
jgi:hypothetical protein